jgi:hypothetical protein
MRQDSTGKSYRNLSLAPNPGFVSFRALRKCDCVDHQSYQNVSRETFWYDPRPLILSFSKGEMRPARRFRERESSNQQIIGDIVDAVNEAGRGKQTSDLGRRLPGLRRAHPSFMPLPSPHRRFGPPFVPCRKARRHYHG